MDWYSKHISIGTGCVCWLLEDIKNSARPDVNSPLPMDVKSGRTVKFTSQVVDAPSNEGKSGRSLEE